MMEENGREMSAMGNNSVFDKDIFEPLSKVAIAALDKLEKATGWLVTPKGKKKDFEDAIEGYNKDIDKDSNLPPLMKAAFKAEARETLKKYCNLNDISNIAIQQMSDEAEPANVDEDWLNYFKEHAQNISREDAKILWGKLLAEECEESGRIPKTLIHILSLMSSKEAKLFETLCGFMPYRLGENGEICDDSLIIGSVKDNDILFDNELNFENLQDLEALGLLHYNVIDIRRILEGEISNAKMGYRYFDSIIEIENLQPEFPEGNVLLTESGKALSSLIERKRIKGFEEYLKGYYESKNYKVKIYKI